MSRLVSPIIPAIIPRSEAELRQFAEAMSGVLELHVDVVDGQFVPFSSWPYEPTGEPKNCERILSQFSLEVDLMVNNPVAAARQWLGAGADRLVFHVETISVESLVALTESTRVTIVVSANNDTPNEVLTDYLPHVDAVQVMGIGAIGSQGQPFDERAVVRIDWLHETFPQIPITIDGSVNDTTIDRLATLPIERFIIGSGITKAQNPKEAWQTFTARVGYDSHQQEW